jgi:hypothetical protein
MARALAIVGLLGLVAWLWRDRPTAAPAVPHAAQAIPQLPPSAPLFGDVLYWMRGRYAG